ncbi:MAG: hypothetical protein JNK63_08095 [Chthonomonas sp.]|nr:hypothetical protein [Chthonomonas sp.]
MREIQQDSVTTCGGEYCPTTYSGGGACVFDSGFSPVVGATTLMSTASKCPVGYIPRLSDWNSMFTPTCVQGKINPATPPL